MTGITKGPWTYSTDEYGDEHVRSADGDEIIRGTVEGGIAIWNVHDAQAIALLPELIEALEAVMVHAERVFDRSEMSDEGAALTTARFILARVRGEG